MDECLGRQAGGVLGCGFRLGPLESVVGYLLPALTPDDAVVGAALKLLVIGRALGVAVVLDVGLVDSWRHDVVLAPRYEQQRRPVFVPEVHVVLLVARREVGEGANPHQPARGRYVVALVDLVGLLPRLRVGEGIVPLLWGKANGLVAVGWVLQDREGRPDLRDGDDPDTLGGHRVYDHACCTVAVVEQYLCKQSARRVAHDDRRLVELIDDAPYVLDDGGDGKLLDRGGVLAQPFDLALEARVGRGQHAVTAALVTLDPLLPASGGHPEAVDQDDGIWSVGCVGGVLCGHGSATSVWIEGRTRQPRLKLINEDSLLLFGGGLCAPQHEVRQGTKLAEELPRTPSWRSSPQNPPYTTFAE